MDVPNNPEINTVIVSPQGCNGSSTHQKQEFKIICQFLKSLEIQDLFLKILQGCGPMLPGNVGEGAETGMGTGTGTAFFETGCVGSSGYFYINIYYKL